MSRTGKVIDVSDARRKLTATPSSENDNQIDLRIVWPLVQWIRDQRGEVAVADLARAAMVRVEELRGGSRWASYASFTALLEAARAMMPDDKTFREACAYRLVEAYGPLRFVTWALSPAFVFRKVSQNLSTISHVHGASVVSTGKNFLRGRIWANCPEHRLACLSRIAQLELLPVMWGLPRAQVVEHSCAALGDAACEYEMHWATPARWTKIATIAVISGALCELLGTTLGSHVPGWFFGGAAGSLLAYVAEMRRERQEQYARVDDMQEAMRAIALQEAQARQELVALSGRESAWNSLLEREVHARTERLGAMVESLQKLHDDRVVTLRGYTHDLKNPLSVLKATGYYLERYHASLGSDGKEMLADHDEAVRSMERLIADVVDLATTSSNMVPVSTEPIRVRELVEEVSRRLRALAFGRDIKTNVVSSRDAPDEMHADTLIVDRIIDNLLTNAVKYTQRGSIAVEFDGTADFLTMKVSDSGRGIAEDAIARIFSAGGSDKADRAPGSHGVGLSVVVHLLDLVGGRIDVMSHVDRGTTFWVYFPIVMTPRPPKTPSAGMADDVIGRVVRIRHET